MSKYINSLKELSSNFIYQDFKDLLNEIDQEIINGSLVQFDSEFLYYFDFIMNFVNDDYLVEGTKITLGNMLIENALINKEKLTPTLMMCFYLNKKECVGLENDCNNIQFCSTPDLNMGITAYNDVPKLFQINWNSYSAKYDDIDEFNYNIMHDVLHEITHVYQETRVEESDNLLDKLTYFDNRTMDIMLEKFFGGNDAYNILIHESLINEQVAEENANVCMIRMMNEHPEYFNEGLINKKLDDYKQRKSIENYMYPRKSFDEMIQYTKNFNIQLGTYDRLKPVFDEIDSIKTKSMPIIAELKAQGISEDYNDSSYNIFLKSFYHFDGENIVLNGEEKNNEGVKN